ncbi:DUF2797 domain-containing protein [Specibacter sp. NPDC057265]|uniref:DUF2797 domain-containing protein n=1 Tax=Specibacter sp. NPDC057265 TaxID=3346075 RepID=UPI00363F5CB1
MAEAAVLVRGVAWTRQGPELLLTTAGQGAARLPLLPGAWLRFHVIAGAGVPARHCLGFMGVQGPDGTAHHPCPTAQAAVRGYQCGACFAKDEMRPMHEVHRGGFVPAGLRSYLAQPHWLYIASFADGTTKVGTASQQSKWSRLAEQGAVAAQYVAQAKDGTVVRLLEDAVSRHEGITQFVRAAAKAAALLNPRPAAELEQRNQDVAHAVRAFLANSSQPGFTVVDQSWQGSEFSRGLLGNRARIAYPQPLDAGPHGLLLESMLGSNALVTLDGAEAAFLAGLGTLRGKKIQFGNFATEIPALQESLF